MVCVALRSVGDYSGVCVLVSGLCSVPYHEVARIFQHEFETQAAATPLLDLVFPCAFFKPDDDLCITIKRDDIMHRLLYNRYEYNTQ